MVNTVVMKYMEKKSRLPFILINSNQYLASTAPLILSSSTKICRGVLRGERCTTKSSGPFFDRSLCSLSSRTAAEVDV